MPLTKAEIEHHAIHLGMTVKDVEDFKRRQKMPKRGNRVGDPPKDKGIDTKFTVDDAFAIVGIIATAILGIFLAYHIIGIVWEYNHIDNMRTEIRELQRENTQQDLDIDYLRRRKKDAF